MSLGFSGAGILSTMTWRGGGDGGGMIFSIYVVSGILGATGGRSLEKFWNLKYKKGK